MDDISDKVKRAYFEQVVARRPLSDAEWAAFGPSLGERLADAARNYAWEKDIDDELAELAELAELTMPISTQEVADTRIVRTNLGRARAAIIQSDPDDLLLSWTARNPGNDLNIDGELEVDPPFSDLAQAWVWMGRQVLGEDDAFRHHEPWAIYTLMRDQMDNSNLVEPPLELSPPDFPVSQLDMEEFACPLPESAMMQLFKNVLLNASPIESDEGERTNIDKRQPERRLRDEWEGHLSGIVQSHTTSLALLAIWSAYLAFVTDGTWSRAGCVAYILAGELPNLPPMRIRPKLVGFSVDFYVPPTRDNLLILYSEMRDRRGVKYKKSFNEEDRALLYFVDKETPGMSDERRLAVLKKRCKDNPVDPLLRFSTYGKGSQLWAAVKSARGRQKRELL
jgi:hypothetical protein